MKFSSIKSAPALSFSMGWIIVVTGITSCNKNGGPSVTVPDKGTRKLGVHITAAQGQTYPAAYAQARSAGVDCVPYTFQWTAVEDSSGYDPQGLMSDINGFYSNEPVSLSLCLSPIAANRRDIPADLASLAFDDPVMISRFNQLLDTLHQRMASTQLRYLLIGNEVDNYFSQHPEEWSAYTRFCVAARAHARSLWGNSLLVGSETTLGASIGVNHQPIDSLHAAMDMVCLTYYPLNNDFSMEPVAQMNVDMETMFAMHPHQQILLQEFGYATSAVCGGSEAAQADFVHQTFTCWDKHETQMVYLAFLWLNDLSDAESQAVTAYYGLNATPVEQKFTAYIRSLGLCNNDGSAKQGFVALQSEAASRGWKP